MHSSLEPHELLGCRSEALLECCVDDEVQCQFGIAQSQCLADQKHKVNDWLMLGSSLEPQELLECRSEVLVEHGVDDGVQCQISIAQSHNV